MKALTVWQPWASLVALGVKTIETRSWSTSYRGPLAIHAAKRRPKMAEAMLLEEAGLTRLVDLPFIWSKTDPLIPFGSVVATCELVDVWPIHCSYSRSGERPYEYNVLSQVTAEDPDDHDRKALIFGEGMSWWRDMRDQFPYGDFSPGRFAWLLAYIKPLPEPIPAKGRQQLWEWTP